MESLDNRFTSQVDFKNINNSFHCLRCNNKNVYMFINRIREIKYGLATYVIIVKLLWE